MSIAAELEQAGFVGVRRRAFGDPESDVSECAARHTSLSCDRRAFFGLEKLAQYPHRQSPSPQSQTLEPAS